VEYRVNGGVALYGAYAADVILDSSALKDAVVEEKARRKRRSLDNEDENVDHDILIDRL